MDFNFFGKQAVWGMDSPLNKVILIRVVQQQAWWFLLKIMIGICTYYMKLDKMEISEHEALERKQKEEGVWKM